MASSVPRLVHAMSEVELIELSEHFGNKDSLPERTSPVSSTPARSSVLPTKQDGRLDCDKHENKRIQLVSIRRTDSDISDSDDETTDSSSEDRTLKVAKIVRSLFLETPNADLYINQRKSSPESSLMAQELLVQEQKRASVSHIVEREGKEGAQVAERKKNGESQVAEEKDSSESRVAERKDNGEFQVAEEKDSSESQVAKEKDSNESQVVERKDKGESKVAKRKDSSESQVAEEKDSNESQVAKEKDSNESQVVEIKDKGESQVAKEEVSSESEIVERKDNGESEIAEREDNGESQVAERKDNGESQVAKEEVSSEFQVVKRKDNENNDEGISDWDSSVTERTSNHSSVTVRTSNDSSVTERTSNDSSVTERTSNDSSVTESTSNDTSVLERKSDSDVSVTERKSHDSFKESEKSDCKNKGKVKEVVKDSESHSSKGKYLNPISIERDSGSVAAMAKRLDTSISVMSNRRSIHQTSYLTKPQERHPLSTYLTSKNENDTPRVKPPTISLPKASDKGPKIKYHKSESKKEQSEFAAVLNWLFKSHPTKLEGKVAKNSSNSSFVKKTTSGHQVKGDTLALPVIEVAADQPANQKTKSFLSRFLSRRPTKTDLQRKGIYQDEPVFGSSLEVLTKNEPSKIPFFVQRCIEAIEEDERNLEVDGLYRASGNLSQVQKIRIEVDQSRYQCLNDEKEVHVLTGSLKLFFRELKEPLVPYKKFLEANESFGKPHSTEDGKITACVNLINELQPPHRATFIYLFEHLKRVQEKSSINRMDINNLAIVFGPTLIWTDGPTQLDITVALMEQNTVVAFLLQKHDIIMSKLSLARH